jgi:hypothetical protein
MRARVRKDATQPAVPKASPSVPWAVRVAATLPKQVRVSNPLLDEDPADTYAVFDLGMPHDLTVFAKADTALGALFVDAEPYVEVLARMGGYSFFRIDGSDALLAANYDLPDAPWLRKDEAIAKPFAGYENFDACVAAQVEGGKSEESARAVCGKLQAEAEKAEAVFKAKYDHIDFKPPAGVAAAAEKGLEYRKKGGGGGLTTSEAAAQGIGSGVARAASLKNRQNQSPDTVRRMKAFFSRHAKNKTIDPKFKGEPWRDKGYVAWLLWGGDPGRAWADKVVGQMEAADAKAKADKGELTIGPGDPGSLQPEQGRRYRRVRTKDAVIVDAIGLLTKAVTKIEDEDDEDDERYILGVVLEPDEVDSQGDTISAEEIRRAAHGYMQEFGNVGLQHQTFVNDKIKILETYIAPVDFEIGGETVKAGTWLMAFRVVDDSIWKAIKEGLLTGLSIGGTGLRLAVA